MIIDWTATTAGLRCDTRIHVTLLMAMAVAALGILAEASPLNASCSLSPDPDVVHGQLVNCSWRGFHVIPVDLPQNATVLLLSSNSLSRVPDDAFSQLRELRELDLSLNRIRSLEPHAFRGLSQLTRLSLWQNSLVLSPRTYPRDLFKPLLSLTTLILSSNNWHPAAQDRPVLGEEADTAPVQNTADELSGNDLKFQKEDTEREDFPLSSRQGSQKTNALQQRHVKIGSLAPLTQTFDVHDDQIQHSDLGYPDDALSHLTNLRHLSMDGLTNKSLGPGFRNLTQLTHLDLNGKSGNSYLVTLDGTTFDNIPGVTHLNLSECGILDLTAEAFMCMHNLTDLDLSFNQALGFSLLDKAFSGLSFTRLTNLTIDLIVPSRIFGTVIKESHLKSFKGLQHLERLQARFNRLEGVEEGCLCRNMPPKLKYLDVGANLWELAPYVNDLRCLRSLTQLSMIGEDGDLTPPLRPPDTHTDSPASSHAGRLVVDEDLTAAEFPVMRTARGSLTVGGTSNGCGGKQFLVPPQLESLNARNMGLNYQLKKVIIASPNNLKRIDMSQNYLPVWQGPMCGFHNVTELCLMNTQAEYVTATFFQGFPALQVLNVSSNKLRAAFQGDDGGRLLEGLGGLRVLDLSHNNLGHILNDTLLPLVSLEELYLRVNGIATFTVDLSHMKRLRHLDVSYNQLLSLPKEIRNHLDSLAETLNVTVSMQFNPISCICNNIDFLRWIRESKVYFGTERNYFCLQPNAIAKKMLDLKGTIAKLEVQCGSYVGIFVGASASCFIFLTILLVALAYRFRWKLRYLYYASRLSFQRQRRSRSQQQEFRFDAFVSFSSEDSEFVEEELRQSLEEVQGLRLCIHTRDFTPGHYIASNIVSSVQRSRRTLVVLSRALLASDWCHYELQMALMEGAHSGRDVLVFLLYEPVPAHELSREMLANLQATVYIECPRGDVEASTRALFWARLAQALRE